MLYFLTGHTNSLYVKRKVILIAYYMRWYFDGLNVFLLLALFWYIVVSRYKFPFSILEDFHFDCVYMHRFTCNIIDSKMYVRKNMYINQQKTWTCELHFIQIVFRNRERAKKGLLYKEAFFGNLIFSNKIKYYFMK